MGGWRGLVGPRVRAGAQIVVGAGVLGAAAFVFETAQSWVDAGISSDLLRWVLPVALALLTILLLGGGALLVGGRRSGADESVDESERLSQAIVAYARQLHAAGRDTALLSLRSSFSLTLHILGFHDTRREVGYLSLDSATILANRLAQAEIHVDDIGWASYLLDDRKQALENITRGEDLARQARAAGQGPALDFLICEAKALRHRALITCREDSDNSMQLLTKGLELLCGDDCDDSKVVRREIAQIYHARAMAIAMALDIHKEGSVRKGDTEAVEMIDQALVEVRKAAEVFNGLDDRARYTKALFLEVRLLEAGGRELEAREARAVRDRTLASSEWSRKEGTMTLTGV